MPNTLNGFQLIDARCIREHRERFRRDLFPELDRANSYYSMAGRWPDVGWLLLDRNSYNQIGPYSGNIQLVIQDFVNPSLTISGLTVVQARCVTSGIVSDPNAIYLIQVTNNEGILYNPWFQFPVNAQYNVRSPAYDTQYYSSTLNSGTAWTWDGMVGDLWSKAGSILGTYPHLPIAPTGTPENWVFIGVSLWEAINRVMDYLGLAISGTSNSLTITVSGATDTNFSNLLTKYLPYLEDSMEYLDSGSGRVPSNIVVYFHVRYKYYGAEETVRRDANQWQSLQPYSITVTSPAQFSSALGTAYLWSDFTVRLDMNGNPLSADVTTANSIAQERATQYLNTIYRGTQGYLRHTYSGVLPFVTGSLIDGVRWYNSDNSGWHTEIIRGYIWPETTFPLTLKGLTGPA